jgi:hypothetical protein
MRGIAVSAAFNEGWAPITLLSGTGGRVAEGARLESVLTGNRYVGSNPTLSV